MSVVPPPAGTVTFLFTDIEGSTKRWEHLPGAMAMALQQHDQHLRDAIEKNCGNDFKTNDSDWTNCPVGMLGGTGGSRMAVRPVIPHIATSSARNRA